jgi:hypothetical protein
LVSEERLFKYQYIFQIKKKVQHNQQTCQWHEKELTISEKENIVDFIL